MSQSETQKFANNLLVWNAASMGNVANQTGIAQGLSMISLPMTSAITSVMGNMMPNGVQMIIPMNPEQTEIIRQIVTTSPIDVIATPFNKINDIK